MSTWPTRGVPEMNTLLAVGGVGGSGAGVTGPTAALVTARPGEGPLWATGVTSKLDQGPFIRRHQGVARAVAPAMGVYRAASGRWKHPPSPLRHRRRYSCR